MAKRVSVVERKQRFLAALQRGCVVGDAAVYAGVVRSTVYLWAQGDVEFASAWKAAELEALGTLRSKAYELAMGGNVRMIMWLIERYESKEGGGEPTQNGTVEIVGLKEGEHATGEFIEFR